LLSGKIFDVAPTNDPAYEQTSVSVSMRSLARYMQAPLEDVQRYAEKNELRAFFERTDLRAGKVSKPPLSGDEAKARLAAIRQHSGRKRLLQTMAAKTSTPDIPEPVEPQTRSGRDALVQFMSLRLTPGREALLKTMQQRYPEPVRTMEQRRAELAALRLGDYESAEAAGLA
jgi:hypothetical protein